MNLTSKILDKIGLTDGDIGEIIKFVLFYGAIAYVAARLFGAH